MSKLETNSVGPWSRADVTVSGLRCGDANSSRDGVIRYRDDQFQFREDGVWKTLNDPMPADGARLNRTIFIPPDKITSIDVETHRSLDDGNGAFEALTQYRMSGFDPSGSAIRILHCSGGPKHVLSHEIPTYLATTYDYFSPDGGITTTSLLDSAEPGIPGRLKKVRCIYMIMGASDANIMECIISKRVMPESDSTPASAPISQVTTHTTSDCPSDPTGGLFPGMSVSAIGNLSVSAEHATTAMRSTAGYHVVDFLLDDPIELTSENIPIIQLWFYGEVNSTSLLYHGTVLFIE